MAIFIKRNEKILGPLAKEAFDKAMVAGRVLPGDQISETRNGPWQPASDLIEKQSSPESAQPAITAPIEKSPAGDFSGEFSLPDQSVGAVDSDAFAAFDQIADREFKEAGGASFVVAGDSSDGSEAIVVEARTGNDKNLHYLDAALASDREEERAAAEEADSDKNKLMVFAIVGPIILLLLIVIPLVLYGASKPIRLRMAADSALNRMILQAAKAESLINAEKMSEANYALGQVQAAAVELELALGRMSESQRASWEQEKAAELLKTSVY